MSMGELSMLRSITKSGYDRSAVSTASHEKRMEKLRRHEYEDESDEESSSQPRVHSANAASQRRRSLVRQNEQALFLSRSNGSGSWDGASLPPRSASAHSRSRNVVSSSGKRVQRAARVATAVGGRTEARHSIPSAAMPAARSGLRYDADFDCYYDPASDQYYKVQAAE